MQQNNQSSSMDVEAAIHSLASAGHDLPREAMRWVLDHWDEAAPDLLTVLERLADGTDRSEEAASGAFFVAHLAAEKRDARAFRPVCRVARDAEAAEAMLGDALTLTLKRILISTYDGDLAALRGVIEARDADPFARGAALEALAYLAATGRVARDDTEAYLRRLFRDFQSEPDSLVWLGWQEAVALLGLESLDALVREAFERELVDPSFLGYEDFREDLERTLADPARMAGFAREQVLPLDDAVTELSGWYGFSAEAGFAKAAALARAAAAYDHDEPPQTPAFNPYKHVGRNDPCPCGSGKKFKKCCLPRVPAP